MIIVPEVLPVKGEEIKTEVILFLQFFFFLVVFLNETSMKTCYYPSVLTSLCFHQHVQSAH